jgi:Bacillus/Clostridium GerA spore germination protein
LCFGKSQKSKKGDRAVLFQRYFRKGSKYGEQESEPRQISQDLVQNEQWLKETFHCSHDVKIIFKEFKQTEGKIEAILVYCEGLSDAMRINREALPAVQQWLAAFSVDRVQGKNIPETWSFASVKSTENIDEVIDFVFEGHLVLFLDGWSKALVLDVANPPRRTPEETNTETSIRGPRDGFVEEISDNISLIRRRLKTKSLQYEQFTVGARSQTKVGLLYISDIINMDIIKEVRKKISKINIDSLNSSTHLEELLTDSPYTIFPIFNYTGRPDFVVDSLLRGRFCLVVDGAPTASIGPSNLTELLKSSEESHTFFLYSTFGVLVRIIGFLIAIFLPGFWVALGGFHQDQIPISLLATFVESRRGVPFPTPIEAFLMLTLFELFREAGLRIPNPLGQTISVVGGLIVGDAAIRSGLTSPSMVVTMAISAITGNTLVNQSLNGIIIALRFFTLFLSSILGVFGFLIALFAITLYLATIKSFGIPYLAPLSPFSFRDFVMAVSRPQAKMQDHRPKMLSTQDSTRQGGEK